MPELFAIGMVMLAITVSISFWWRAKQRKINQAASLLVRELLSETYHKGDHVEAYNKGSRSSKTSKCPGIIVEPPFFKDDGKRIAVTIRSDRDSKTYIKSILVLDDKGQWQRTQISLVRTHDRRHLVH